MTPTKRDEERAREICYTAGPLCADEKCVCHADAVKTIAQALAEAREEGRRSGIEEAAKVCQSVTQRGIPLFPEHVTDTSEWLSEICATAIRALLDAPHSEGVE